MIYLLNCFFSRTSFTVIAFPSGLTQHRKTLKLIPLLPSDFLLESSAPRRAQQALFAPSNSLFRMEAGTFSTHLTRFTTREERLMGSFLASKTCRIARFPSFGLETV